MIVKHNSYPDNSTDIHVSMHPFDNGPYSNIVIKFCVGDDYQVFIMASLADSKHQRATIVINNILREIIILPKIHGEDGEVYCLVNYVIKKYGHELGNPNVKHYLPSNMKRAI